MTDPARLDRLPIRIPPVDGESWLGYTHRVAAFYHLPWRTLMRHLILNDPHSLRYWHMPRLAGYAATTPTRETFAAFFRLEPSEVADMHLSRYHGSALDFPAQLTLALDPLSTETDPANASLGSIGRLVSVRKPRGCPDCLRGRPDHRPLSWHLTFHVACVHHGLLHVPLDRHTPIPADTNTIDAQALILQRLTPHPENRRFFTTLELILTARVAQGRPHRLNAKTTSLAEALPEVVPLAADPDPSIALSYALDTTNRLGHITLPRISTEPVDPRWIPPLLPTRHLIPHLADLLYPLPIRRAREVAACAARMSLTGESATAACSVLGQRPTTPAAIHHTLRRLQSQGRLGHFLDATGRASHALLGEQIDYPQRALHASRPDLIAVANQIVIVASGMAKSWLVDQWACTYTSSRERTTSRDGRLENYDREHGPAITAALETILNREAA
ncbi:MAG: TniQ family protein [Tetrasphaera sp.]